MGQSFLKAIENAKLVDSGFYHTLSLISGKYKMAVLYSLSIFEVMRFNEMQRFLRRFPTKPSAQRSVSWSLIS